MVCLDTMIVIWAVQGASRAGQEGMVERARRYLRALRDDNERIMIPTPAVAEYLQGFELAERKDQLVVLARHFVIPVFDLPAAFLAAGLARRAIPPEGIPRQSVKTDVQILATAIRHRATKIVTDERAHFEKLAQGKIVVSELPSVEEQTGLFDV